MSWKTDRWKSLLRNRIKKNKRNEDSLRDFWNNIKGTNIHVIGVPEREEIKGLRKYMKR